MVNGSKSLILVALMVLFSVLVEADQATFKKSQEASLSWQDYLEDENLLLSFMDEMGDAYNADALKTLISFLDYTTTSEIQISSRQKLVIRGISHLANLIKLFPDKEALRKMFVDLPLYSESSELVYDDLLSNNGWRVKPEKDFFSYSSFLYVSYSIFGYKFLADQQNRLEDMIYLDMRGEKSASLLLQRMMRLPSKDQPAIYEKVKTAIHRVRFPELFCNKVL